MSRSPRFIFINHPTDTKRGFTCLDISLLVRFKYLAPSEEEPAVLTISWENETTTQYEGLMAVTLASYLMNNLSSSDEFIEPLTPEEIIKFDFTY